MVELLALGALALVASAALRGASSPARRTTTTRSTTAMHRAYYRTRDGQADYRFGFRQQPDGTWRAYILAQPDYQGRNTSPHATHRLHDADGHYICWTRPLRSLEEAKHVAAAWADKTQEYIATGRRF